MYNNVFVVTCSIEQGVDGEWWTNYEVVGCFCDEQKADKFAKDYEQKIAEEYKGQKGWGTPTCEVHETEIQ